MGKGILLIVGAVMLGATYFALSEKQSSLAARNTQSTYEHRSLARDAARSGMDRALSEVKRDPRLEAGASSTLEASTSSGSYTASAEENGSYGDVVISVKSSSGPLEHTAEAHVIYETALDAALVVDAANAKFVGHGSDYRISGMDNRSSKPDQYGFLKSAHGIRSKTAPFERSGSSNIEVRASDGAVAVKDGTPPSFDYEALYSEALGKVDRTIDLTSFGSRLEEAARGDQVYLRNAGSADDPQIVRVRGGLTVKFPEYVSGYGLLIVEDGDFDVESLDWKGLVMVRKDATKKREVKLKKRASVEGGFIVYDYSGGGQQCAPDFEVSDRETTPEDEYRVDATAIGAAIEVPGDYHMPVTAQVEIDGETFEPWGSYDDPRQGNVNPDALSVSHRGAIPVGGGRVFEEGSSIRINARSWERGRPIMKRVMRTRTVCTQWRGYLFWRRCVAYEEREVYEWVETGEYEWQVYFEKKASGSYADNLRVLRDRSTAPDRPAYLEQTSAETYVRNFIISDPDNPSRKMMSLEADQSINLFELGSTNSSLRNAAFDLQDLVVMLDLKPVDIADCNYPPATENKLTFSMHENALISYSPEAVAKLGQRLNFVKDRTEIVIARQSDKGDFGN